MRDRSYAHENNFNYFATTLGISRWKDMDQINSSGMRAAKRYKNLKFWDFNWRKDGGSSRMIEISKERKILSAGILRVCLQLERYKSLEKKNNRDRIIRGVKFYS